jgi:hypothetical protein
MCVRMIVLNSRAISILMLFVIVLHSIGVMDDHERE